LFAITCFCICFCANSARASRNRAQTPKSQRPLKKEQTRELGNQAQGPVGAGRLGYPSGGYEPVRCEEQSVSSDNRAISMASSEAAGLRLLGHDGM
jgi:hypothetical protein